MLNQLKGAGRPPYASVLLYVSTDRTLEHITLSSEDKVMFNNTGTRLVVVVDDDGRDDVLPKVPNESGTCT